MKATRHIPIVFVDGQGEALEKTKAKVPGAIFIASDELERTIDKLLKSGNPAKPREAYQ